MTDNKKINHQEKEKGILSDTKVNIMKNTLTIEEINKIEKAETREVINALKDYSSYANSELSLLKNVSTIDKSIYLGVLLKRMKATEVVEKTGMSKSNVSRMGKVGKWILSHKELYHKLVFSAGTQLSFRTLCDAITHDNVPLDGEWDSLVTYENEYKREYNKTKSSKSSGSGSKPSTDGKKVAHAFSIEDFEKMNTTSVYSAIIDLVDCFKEDSTQAEPLVRDFIKRLNELKH